MSEPHNKWPEPARSRPSRRWLAKWAAQKNFWIRRTALLAQHDQLKRGEGDWVLFTRLAAGMLDEKEFFIRKAIGWVLREISKRDPGWVVTWTADHAREMSGVTFREAVRRLPPAAADHLRALREAPPT